MLHNATLEIAGRQPYRLTGPGPWTLGRSDSADISFPDDPHCSRTQAIVRLTREGLTIEPVSTVSPTSLNGEVLDGPRPLADGDEVRFAAQTISVQAAEKPTMLEPSGRSGQSKPGGGKMAVQNNLVVVRRDDAKGPQQGLVLDHPTVSRRHARFIVSGGVTSIEDLGSTNGTFVNGTRITRRTPLAAGDVISIGVYALDYDGKNVAPHAQAKGASLAADAISKIVHPKRTKVPLTIVDKVSLHIASGELVCIIGASGSGKSTLMNMVSGRKRPSEGTVRLGEYDIHAFFDTLKQDMAYVPQSDLLHEDLTLRKALTYVAQLRLPRDIGADARSKIVVEAAASVGLEPRLDVKIASLSGGQKKRASLATEILSRPNLLFLDEVTSGLDESTDREIMGLLKRLTERGMTIVCVTHTLANILEFADKVIVMAEGGTLAFCGPPAELLSFFSIKYLGEVFGAIERAGAEHWRTRYERTTSPGRGAPRRSSSDARPPPRDQEGSLVQQIGAGLHQFAILTQRNVSILLGDTRTLIMAAIQSVVVGALLGYAFGDFGKGTFEIANSKLSFLLVLGITCLWIGCAGASKEIVGELPIYLRERDINLSTLAFVASKFLVSGGFAVAQVALLLLTCGVLVQEIPGPLWQQAALAALAGINGAAIGLVISSIANSRDQAAVIVPLALAPQLILGSGLVSNLPAAGQWLAKIFVGAYWARDSMTAALISVESLKKFDPHVGTLVEVTSHTMRACVGALTGQAFGWIALATIVMYWRHAHKSE